MKETVISVEYLRHVMVENPHLVQNHHVISFILFWKKFDIELFQLSRWTWKKKKNCKEKMTARLLKSTDFSKFIYFSAWECLKFIIAIWRCHFESFHFAAFNISFVWSALECCCWHVWWNHLFKCIRKCMRVDYIHRQILTYHPSSTEVTLLRICMNKSRRYS